MTQDEPRLLQHGVELLTRFLNPVDVKDDTQYVALPHGLEAVMAVASAGLALATLAGTEHGIAGTQEATQRALQHAGCEPLDSEEPPVLVDRQRSSRSRT